MTRVEGNPSLGLRPYCIDKYDSMASNSPSPGSTQLYSNAAGSCLGRGYALCSANQYIRACGVAYSGATARWTSVPASSSDFFVVGSGSFESVSYSGTFLTYLHFRCCLD
ncbi:MAG: hypothetical protein KF789_14560, partial [Bdellovibrionaceae bacterium]|nr:hypothetical protein [Pseudobdellovibrionaceae bacterium]